MLLICSNGNNVFSIIKTILFLDNFLLLYDKIENGTDIILFSYTIVALSLWHGDVQINCSGHITYHSPKGRLSSCLRLERILFIGRLVPYHLVVYLLLPKWRELSSIDKNLIVDFVDDDNDQKTKEQNTEKIVHVQIHYWSPD